MSKTCTKKITLSTRYKRYPKRKGDVLLGHINAVKEAQLPKQPHNYVFYQVQYFKKAKGGVIWCKQATHKFQEIPQTQQSDQKSNLNHYW